MVRWRLPFARKTPQTSPPEKLRAITFEEFGGPLAIASLADPVPTDDGVVVAVKASGICRSDWHGWMGHDTDITELPHVPGHELAGTVEVVGKNVKRWRRGDRVTVPFVSGCGTCPECISGNHQVCDHQYQPGFSGWGSFAEFVSLKYADTNLVRLPDEMDFATAAILGCRFGTSFRAVVAQGNVSADEWVVVHGCGGVGLSAVMIAVALGAQVVAVDIDARALAIAQSLGATATINAADRTDIADAVRDVTGRGAHVSLDALGSAVTCTNSIRCLRKRGRHVQVGLLVGRDSAPEIPMDKVIAKELEIFGSHGLQASRYKDLLRMIGSGQLDPGRLIEKAVGLDEVPSEIEKMGSFSGVGITIVDRF